MIIIYNKTTNLPLFYCADNEMVKSRLTRRLSNQVFTLEDGKDLLVPDFESSNNFGDKNIQVYSYNELYNSFGYIEVNNKLLARDIVSVGVKTLTFNEDDIFSELELNDGAILNAGLLATEKD